MIALPDIKLMKYEEKIYEANNEIREENYGKAFNIYLELANNGSIDCQRFIGWMYYTGKGVDKDLRKASDWFSKAADKGDIEAKYGLGKVYISSENYSKSLTILLECANQGFPAALYSLGVMYRDGKGVETDRDKAYMYFKNGMKNGNLWSHRAWIGMLLGGYKGLLNRVIGVLALVYYVPRFFFIALKDKHDTRFLS